MICMRDDIKTSTEPMAQNNFSSQSSMIDLAQKGVALNYAPYASSLQEREYLYFAPCQFRSFLNLSLGIDKKQDCH